MTVKQFVEEISYSTKPGNSLFEKRGIFMLSECLVVWVKGGKILIKSEPFYA